MSERSVWGNVIIYLPQDVILSNGLNNRLNGKITISYQSGVYTHEGDKSSLVREANLQKDFNVFFPRSDDEAKSFLSSCGNLAHSFLMGAVLHESSKELLERIVSEHKYASIALVSESVSAQERIPKTAIMRIPKSQALKLVPEYLYNSILCGIYISPRLKK